MTVLSILEIARLHRIRLLQHGHGGEIYLTRTAELHTVSEQETDDSFDG